MGSYAYLTLDGATIHSSKDDVDPSVMVLFRESDRRVLPFPADQWGGDEEDAPAHTVLYAAKLGVVRDRLELMGVTLNVVKEVFEEGIVAEAAIDPHWAANLRQPKLVSVIEAEQETLRSLTFERWLAAFEEIASGRFRDVQVFSEDFLRLPPLHRHMLRNQFDFQFGFPSPDSRFFLRAVAELRSPDLELVYDLTELIADAEADAEYPYAWLEHGAV